MTTATRPRSDNRPLDIRTAAAVLGVKVRYLRQLVTDGRIRYIKMGHLLRFRPDDLHAFLDSLVVEPSDTARERAHAHDEPLTLF